LRRRDVSTATSASPAAIVTTRAGPTRRRALDGRAGHVPRGEVKHELITFASSCKRFGRDRPHHACPIGGGARRAYCRSVTIPALEPSGLLPPGVHDAAVDEIEAAFGTSNRRREELFAKLDLFVGFAQSFQLFTALFVDGSFLTDKDLPSDIDGVLELPRPNLTQLLSHPQALLIVDTAAVKATYEVHLFFQPPPPVPAGLDMARFFQGLKPEEALLRGLPTSVKRGILKVTL